MTIRNAIIIVFALRRIIKSNEIKFNKVFYVQVGLRFFNLLLMFIPLKVLFLFHDSQSLLVNLMPMQLLLLIVVLMSILIILVIYLNLIKANAIQQLKNSIKVCAINLDEKIFAKTYITNTDLKTLVAKLINVYEGGLYFVIFNIMMVPYFGYFSICLSIVYLGFLWVFPLLQSYITVRWNIKASVNVISDSLSKIVFFVSCFIVFILYLTGIYGIFSCIVCFLMARINSVGFHLLSGALFGVSKTLASRK